MHSFQNFPTDNLWNIILQSHSHGKDLALLCMVENKELRWTTCSIRCQSSPPAVPEVLALAESFESSIASTWNLQVTITLNQKSIITLWGPEGNREITVALFTCRSTMSFLSSWISTGLRFVSEGSLITIPTFRILVLGLKIAGSFPLPSFLAWAIAPVVPPLERPWKCESPRAVTS